MAKILDKLTEKIKHAIPLSFGELKEVRRRKKAQIEDYKDAHKRKEFPIFNSVEDAQSMAHNDKKRYLQYCISLIRQEHPKEHDLLVLTLMGWKEERIAREMNKQGFNFTVAYVRRKVSDARRLVAQKIEQIKKSGIPIFSDIPVTEHGLPPNTGRPMFNKVGLLIAGRA